MYYWIEWKDLEGTWIREEIYAQDFEDADNQAGVISKWFGTGEHRTDIFGHSKKQSR
jgi:hypothetical protein